MILRPWLATILVAGAPSDMGPVDPARFDHARHEKALEKEGLPCVACHAVGGAPPSAPAGDAAEGDAEALAAPAASCHWCHVAETRQVRAPSRCDTCHASVGPPPDHGAGWLDVHGDASRTERCDSCHRTGFCVDCHERREPVRYQVHDRAFLSVHGIEVRTDPAACGACHTESFCVDCHAARRVSR